MDTKEGTALVEADHTEQLSKGDQQFKDYQNSIGSTTEREVVRFARGKHVKATPLETVALVRELAREFDDAQIARILNRQGRRSGMP